jgi:hypothetical protein
MLRTTTLLIVMMLLGNPGGALACERWCTSPAAEGHHRAVGCHSATVITPFVIEARQTESASVAPLPLVLFAFRAIGLDDEVAAGWRIFNVQPPRPGSSGAVLRI